MSQNLNRSLDPDYNPFGVIMHMLVLIMDQISKLTSYIHAKDMTGTLIFSGPRDPDHAHLG